MPLPILSVLHPTPANDLNMKLTKLPIFHFSPLTLPQFMALCVALVVCSPLSGEKAKQTFLTTQQELDFEKSPSNYGEVLSISFESEKPSSNKGSVPTPLAIQSKVVTKPEPAPSPASEISLSKPKNENLYAQATSPVQPRTSSAPAYSAPSSPRQPNPSSTTYPNPAIGSANSPYAFHSYRLSYMQSDRALALLKALGYSTVEYSAGRGESINESIFSTFQQSYKYPIVVKILDAAKTSLMQPSLDGGFNPASATDRLSGTYLHQSTTGAPEQRLLVVYEKNQPEQLNALLNLMHNEIDVPAAQIVIEALVIEIDTTEAKELGLKYNLYGKRDSHSFDGSSFSSKFNSDQNSFFGWNANRITGTYDTNNYDAYGNFIGSSPVPIYGAMERANPLGFSAELKASVANGTAEVLSNPTILVLDGRQALIRVGTQIPNKTVVQTNYGSQESITYIDTGIVLNIRPRISEDGAEVTMQTETIVSTSRPYLNDPANPPEIESKTVQSFVRVADNTPFIIGGLIEKDKTDGRTGIPILSDIPVLGKLFQSTTKKEGAREVIIVLTPHIINTEEKSFSYVIPKDSQSFDSFDNMLFRNAYRIRDDDLFDLSFATQSEFFQNILAELQNYQDSHPEIAEDAPIFNYLNDKVPGEEVIVRRMIWEIVHKSKYHEYISNDHILLFESHDEATYGNKFKTNLLNLLLERLVNTTEQNSLVLNFAKHKAQSKGPFEHPRAEINLGQVKDPGNYVEQMSLLNAQDPNRNTLLLCPEISPPGVRGANALEVLKGVLVLKRILALNSSMPVTINEFRVGRQIIFPTEQELKDKYHVVDYDAVRFFYEVINYYPEFENAFNRDCQAILGQIRTDQK
jgi:Flp pilus assembly secretin CpaC